MGLPSLLLCLWIPVSIPTIIFEGAFNTADSTQAKPGEWELGCLTATQQPGLAAEEQKIRFLQLVV